MIVYMLRDKHNNKCTACNNPASYRFEGKSAETFSCRKPNCYIESHELITKSDKGGYCDDRM